MFAFEDIISNFEFIIHIILISYYILLLIILLIGIAGIVAIILLLGRIRGAIRRYGIPRVRTKDIMINHLLENIDIKPGQTLIDLGCGEGVIMSAIQSGFPGVITRGYEINATDYNLAKSKQEYFGNRSQVLNTNFFHADISDANIVYCYLMPHLMKSVRRKVKRECNAGTILYSNAFKIPNIIPTFILQLPSDSKFLNIIYAYEC